MAKLKPRMTLIAKAIIELLKLRRQMSIAHDCLRDIKNKKWDEKADELSGANLIAKDWIEALRGKP